MAVSKRTRYEVLKRDNHTCRYCGGTAPDVKLTVDHVTPVALGGTDKPDNLVTACQDCNAGKSSTTPDAALVADVSQEALRWADAVKVAAAAMAEESRANANRNAWFVKEWKGYGDTDLTYLPDGWSASIDCWTGAGLPEAVLSECLSIAMGNRNVTYPNVFAYMGGIARKKIEKLHDAAKAIVEAGEVVTDGP